MDGMRPHEAPLAPKIRGDRNNFSAFLSEQISIDKISEWGNQKGEPSNLLISMTQLQRVHILNL
jgi:hypothetical protein